MFPLFPTGVIPGIREVLSASLEHYGFGKPLFRGTMEISGDAQIDHFAPGSTGLPYVPTELRRGSHETRHWHTHPRCGIDPVNRVQATQLFNEKELSGLERRPVC